MSKPRISIIAAIGTNRVLGKDNALLWRIPEDFKRFKAITTGHPVIMGRKTFESIGRPLPNRKNIVISRNAGKTPGIHPEVEMASSLDDAIQKASGLDQSEIFILGGGQIYEQGMALADRLYLTLVDTAPEGDTYFPDYSLFSKKISEEKSSDENFSYSFLVFEK